MVTAKHHIFVCTSSRINGTQQGYCYQQKGVNIVQAFLEEIDDRELSGEVMINNTGCFGICDKGPIVVVYPEGVWYGNVSPDDVERIMDEHIEGGTPVEDLLI
ncbi:MAG: hypothetical protein PWP30_791 [Eubacteriaceae bacterium]|jgi:(2Fe-2S) ferredoxin|nr:hypothetical protein [Eubacteriaceae bacterium]